MRDAPEKTLIAGTEVTARCNGKSIKGLICGCREIKRKGRKRELAAIVTGDENSLNQWVYQIVDEEKVAWYEVGCYSAKPTGREVLPREAHERFHEVKQQIADSRFEHKQRRLSEADDGVLMARNGDIIQADFKDWGWTDVIYRGIVEKSGNVRYEQTNRPGKTRTMAPKFFRLKTEG